MKGILRKCLPLFLLAGLTAHAASPEESDSFTASANLSAIDDNFREGLYEATFAAGPLFSPTIAVDKRPELNYAVGALQLGYMLTPPAGRGFFRGNFELAPEAFAGEIFDGSGHYVAGGTLWLRYNLLPLDCRLVPYVQAGGGFVFTDLDRYLLGENFNFNVDGAAGVRCFITRRCTLNLEYRFQHISNANLARKNVGINAQGPVLGVSWFF